MNLNPVLQTLTTLPARLRQRARGMFNLNDPRWGRDDDNNKTPPDESKPEAGRDEVPPVRPPAPSRPQGQGQGPNQGPPDLDELWRDFNRKLGGLFGGAKNAGQRGRGNGGLGGGGSGGPGGFQPDMKSAGIGVGLIAGVAVLIWLG
ncbi:MAG: protease modulator HflK N-terminal domain-containing protein, partial [Polaromonas sp.]|nr:protease modulator HflK N-terminal domain-containing protein [Polaromonas sp.]